ncbi:MAG: MarR family transcriptional regulator [Deltaproteobacteria bacterium]|nr:MarR family transcriptional regulator [Deltaproteobacteria bacterium]
MSDKLILTPAAEKFILHWGEMGSRWGISRSVAQIQSLLYVSERPLHADEIVTTLSLARSNVSTALRELQTWGLVRVVHLPGDRRDHFVTICDAWEMLQTVVAERKKREIDPIILLLRECLAEINFKGEHETLAVTRIRELLSFFDTAVDFYEQISSMPKAKLQKAMKLGRQLVKLLTNPSAKTKQKLQKKEK